MDQPSFFNELTIYENLLLIASSRKIKKQEAFDKIERILDGLGLKKYENYSPSELSKGTMQRLNNACAIIQISPVFQKHDSEYESRVLPSLDSGALCFQNILFFASRPHAPFDAEYATQHRAVNTASHPPECDRPPSEDGAFQRLPRGVRQKSAYRRSQYPSSVLAEDW